MELLEGETLHRRLTKGALPWREAIEVGAAISEGLAAAHTKGIVHRDLKPENLFLTVDSRVKILDFGLARITPHADPQSETGPYIPDQTGTGTVMGTVGYMSPEQVRGQPADARSDLFSLGCVLYETVTGLRAFQRDTAAETMTAILHDEPPDPATSGQAVPAELGRIIRHCLAKSPSQRLQSARDLAQCLRAAGVGPHPRRAPVNRRPAALIPGIVTASLLMGGIGTSMYVLTRSSKHSQSAKPPGEEAKAIDALAVLPFDNVGGDPTTEYLSDGLTDHLINGLGQARRHGLKVRPFASVSRYKRQRPDLPTVGRDLNVGKTSAVLSNSRG
jgi:serine/threonine protein kinase